MYACIALLLVIKSTMKIKENVIDWLTNKKRGSFFVRIDL